MSVGFDAFALNVGPPSDWVTDAVSQLFEQAERTGFMLFLSFDMLQEPDLSQHLPLFQQFQDHSNYFRAGPNNLPVVSSYGGYQQMNDWATLKGDSGVYLMLNLDDIYAGQGDISLYYADPSGQLSEFNNIVDGYFSWESAWPASTNEPANVTAGGYINVITFAHGAKKDYMMGISPLQYKNLNGDTWYRVGEANLPERMEQILAIKLDFVEFITWNDAGESHYIGNVWEEGYDPAIIAYANNGQWPH
ncbi:glycoside hydrolase [Aspergillus insuetus]